MSKHRKQKEKRFFSRKELTAELDENQGLVTVYCPGKARYCKRGFTVEARNGFFRGHDRIGSFANLFFLDDQGEWLRTIMNGTLTIYSREKKRVVCFFKDRRGQIHQLGGEEFEQVYNLKAEAEAEKNNAVALKRERQAKEGAWSG